MARIYNPCSSNFLGKRFINTSLENSTSTTSLDTFVTYIRRIDNGEQACGPVCMLSIRAWPRNPWGWILQFHPCPRKINTLYRPWQSIILLYLIFFQISFKKIYQLRRDDLSNNRRESSIDKLSEPVVPLPEIDHPSSPSPLPPLFFATPFSFHSQSDIFLCLDIYSTVSVYYFLSFS